MALAVAAIVAFPAAADEGWSFTVEAGKPIPGLPAGLSEFTTVELADGRLLFVYAESSPSGGVLKGVVTDAEGALLVGPISVADIGTTAATVAGAPRGSNGAVVVWAAAGSVAGALFDANTFTAFAPDAFAGQYVNSCQVAAAATDLVLACDSWPNTLPADPAHSRIARLAPSGAATTPLVDVVADPLVESGTRGLTVDGNDDAWLLFQTVSSSVPGAVDLAMASVDPAGLVRTSPKVLLAGTEAQLPAQIAASSSSTADVSVAFVEREPSSPTPTIRIQAWTAGSGAPEAASSLTANEVVVQDIRLRAAAPLGDGVQLMGWIEGSDAFPAPVVPHATFAVVEDGGALVAGPSVSRTAVSQFARFGGGMTIVDVSPSPSVFVVHIVPPASEAAPPPSTAASPALVFAAVLAVTGGTLVSLAGFSDRFKWALLAAVWPLYAALQRERVLLDNMRRGAILQVINESPGIRFSDLARRTQISQGALKHHLKILEDFGFVSKSFGRRSLTLYPMGKNPIREEPFKEIRDQILREVRAAPGITHAELARRLGIKWTTLQYHTETMHADKAVRMRRSGRVRRYYPLDEQ